MEYCFNQFIDNLRQIDYPNFKIVIFDNSRTKSFFRKIKKNPFIKVFHDNTKEEKNIMRLISSRNKILDYAAEKNFDYILMLDNDVMVKPDILKKLLNFNKEVVSGLYFNHFEKNGKKISVPVAFASITQKEFDLLKEKGNLPKHAKTKEDVMRYIIPSEIKDNSLLEVRVPSGGCLLLSRKAFTSGARYGREDFPNEVFVSDDIYFFNQLIKKGFKLYCAPKVLCEHLTIEKYRFNKGTHPLKN